MQLENIFEDEDQEIYVYLSYTQKDYFVTVIIFSACRVVYQWQFSAYDTAKRVGVKKGKQLINWGELGVFQEFNEEDF